MGILNFEIAHYYLILMQMVINHLFDVYLNVYLIRMQYRQNEVGLVASNNEGVR